MDRKLLFLWCIFTLSCGAADKCVGPSDTGTGSGADWDNLLAWSSDPSRGDTWFLADGVYAAKTFSVAESGTSGIIIRKAVETNHGPATGWATAYGDGEAQLTNLTISTGYWRIDGASRSSTTSGYGLRIYSGGKNLNITGDNIVVKYVDMQGTGPDDVGSPANDGLYAISSQTNLVVSYCYAHDHGRTAFLLRSLKNFVLEWSVVARNETHVSQHSEGVSLYGAGTENCVFRYNTFIDTEGTGACVVGDAVGCKFYGNLVYWTAGYPNAGQEGGYTGNGSLTSWSTETQTNCLYFNNTVIIPATGGVAFGLGSIGGSAGTGNAATNNLFFSSGDFDSRVSWHSGTAHDYSGYSGASAFAEGSAVTNVVSGDFVSVNSYSFGLTRGIVGMALGSEYETDLSGNTRTTGSWDIGAYEYLGRSATAGTVNVGTLIITP